MCSSIVVTGCEVGTVLALLVSPIITRAISWDWIFYIFGPLGILWSIMFAILGSSSPSKSWFTSTKEAQYILQSYKPQIENTMDQEATPTEDTKLIEQDIKPSTPWKKILLSMAVWSIVVAHTCFNYGWCKWRLKSDSFRCNRQLVTNIF